MIAEAIDRAARQLDARPATGYRPSSSVSVSRDIVREVVASHMNAAEAYLTAELPDITRPGSVTAEQVDSTVIEIYTQCPQCVQGVPDGRRDGRECRNTPEIPRGAAFHSRINNSSFGVKLISHCKEFARLSTCHA